MITVEQHWYGSAPIGLEVSRGFQTLAHSAGLADFRALKAHCVYRRPTGLREGSPVNWGWFPLDAEQVCIHRIGYAGTDELGRPGNFLAHNLVVRTSDLAAIDFDIPALVRWVRQRSPLRFGSATQSDGFAATYAQLYQVLDPGASTPDKTKLQKAPALRVPLEEVQQIRQKVDRDWEGSFLAELRQKFKPAALDALLRAFLCPAEQRRPVLVVGVGNGAKDSELEWKLVEWLFAVLPYCSRRELTFATYEHDIATMLAPPRPGAPPAPHRPRQLILTTTFNDTRLPPTARNIPLWLCNTKTGQLVMPPESIPDIPGELSDWMKQKEHGWVREFRNVASCFAFRDNWPGLCDVWALEDLADREPEANDYPLFIRLADSNRPGQPVLLRLGSQLTQKAEQLLAEKQILRGHFARMFVQLLCVQAPHLKEEDRSSLLQETAWSLLSFFRWALYPGSEEHLRYLFWVFASSPNLADLHTTALTAFRQNLSGKEHLDRAETLLELCHQVRQQIPDSLASVAFLGGVGAVVVDLLDRAQTSGRTVRTPPEKVLLPVLQMLPVEKIGDLERRLRLLFRVSGTPALGTVLLETLTRTGLLSATLLASLQLDPPFWLLRHYQEWREASRSAETLRSLLGHTALFQRYIEGAPSSQGRPPNSGTPPPPLDGSDSLPHVCLALVVVDASNGQRLPELARWYASGGQPALLGQLRNNPRSWKREVLLNLPRAHAAVLQAVLPHLNDAARALVTEHLSALLAFVLGIPRLPQWDEVVGEPVLAPLLPILSGWFRDVESRVQLMMNVTDRIVSLRSDWGAALKETSPLLDALQIGLVYRGLDKGEAAWHSAYLENHLRKPDSVENTIRRTAAAVLEQVPSLAGTAGRATEFGAWLAKRIDFEVWKNLTERLLRDLQPERVAQEGPKWFGPESVRGPLLDQLHAQGLLAGAGKYIAKQHAEPRDSSLQLLSELAYLPMPASLAEPILQRLGQLLQARLDQLEAVAKQRQMQDPEWSPPLEEARQVVQSLVVPLTSGAGTVHINWLCWLWDYLGRALVTFALDDVPARNTFRRLFPSIFRYGEILAVKREVYPEQVWGELFWPAASSGRVSQERFAQLFVAAAEGLIACGLPEETQQVLDCRKGDILYDIFVSTDPLLPILCRKPPEVLTSQVETQDEINAVFYRAQLATLLYAEDPEKLAAVFLGMGYPQGEVARGALFYPRVSALALFACLLQEGAEQDAIVKRRDQLLRSPFWKAFVKGMMERGRQFYADLHDLFSGYFQGEVLEGVLLPFQRQFNPKTTPGSKPSP